MVEGEFMGGENDAAVLAGIAIPQQDVLAGESAGLMGDAAVFEEPNDRRHLHLHASGVQSGSMLLFGSCNALQDQYESTACRADIDGLIGSVQDQDRALHG